MGQDVAPEIIRGLLAIQHRGQDAAGVVTFDTRFNSKKGPGLVRDVFLERHLDQLRGNIGVGHVRYPTVGSCSANNAQPFWLDFPLGIAMAHNGNVTNYKELKETFFSQKGYHLASESDLEAILYVFTTYLIENPAGEIINRLSAATKKVFDLVKGAYSVIGIIPQWGMFAFRDPHGIKPLVFGRRQDSFSFASESVVLDINKYSEQTDILPGELVFIDNQRHIFHRRLENKTHNPCIFELVYFARPDSTLDGVNVYEARGKMGQALGEKWLKESEVIDSVVPIPESSRIAAQQMAQHIGIPYREGFIKNHYIGRTFIMPRDKERQTSVRTKLNIILPEFKNKRTILVDDSIVRGNTSREIVNMVRQAGVKKVIFTSCCPEVKFPCPYGIDMSSRKEFLARGRTLSEITKIIGADKVIYQDIPDLHKACGKEIDFCMACLNGKYPTDITEEELTNIEIERTLFSNE